MADYTHRVVVTTSHEWLIPAGAAIAEFGKAYTAAKQAAQSHGIDTTYDDWALLDVTDDAVVIRVTSEGAA